MSRLLKSLQFILVAALVVIVCSCTKQPQNTTDPYESANRKLCAVNMVADNLFFRPLATLYVTITPNFLQAGIHNMFKNIFSTTTIFNDALQGRPDFVAGDTTRLLLNSTIGILGFFDVAKHFKLPYHYEDFGMTLAYWGAKNSTYFVVPILGPRTVRDTFGIPFDIVTNPIFYLRPFLLALGVATGAMIDTRAQYLAADPMIAQSFDPYSFVRDAYMQNRQQIIDTNNSLKSYREFQAQQLQAYAAPLTNADDTGVSPSLTVTAESAPEAPPQPHRAYQPSAMPKSHSQ